MTGRDLVLAALHGTPTVRAPWVPFVGCHGGALIGVDATTYLNNADHLVAGLTAAIARYRPDGLPIAFDLQLEAEVLGCALHWAEDGPPSVTSHPLSMLGGQTLDDLPPFDLTAGRIPLVLEATRRMRATVGEDIALYGLICGPFTLAMHLCGNDIFLTMFDDPDAVQQVVAHAAAIGRTLAAAYIAAGADVIAVVDPMCSQISLEHFDTFVAPHMDTIFDHIHSLDALGSIFVCGDATRNLPGMCRTHCDNVSVDENIDLAELAKLARAHGTSFGGNIKLTVALLLGTPLQCQHDAIRALEQGAGPGFILAPGCDLPFATPPENLAAIAAVVHDPYARETAAATQAVDDDDDFADILIPDYAISPDVIVDVITLDSKTCAPCQYMVSAVQRACADLDGVRWAEHTVTGRDGLGYLTKLGVEHIPSICINGTVAFASITPDVPTLRQAIVEQRR